MAMAIIVFASCNTTKYVPDNKYLLNDIHVRIDDNSVNKEEVATHLRQKENLKILGFSKFHLWIYNLSRKNKPNGWLKRIGESPVIYDEGLKNGSIQQIEQYMYNKGYYSAIVSDTVLFKRKKANVVFDVSANQPYRIRNIKYRIEDNTLASYIFNTNPKSLIKTGELLDVDKLDWERERISRVLKNNGYFKFAEEYIHYKIDTSFYRNVADVEIIVESIADSVKHLSYNVNAYEIYIDNFSVKEDDKYIKKYSDTLSLDGYTLFYSNKLPISEKIIIESIELRPNTIYSKMKEENTYNRLYSLRQFKYVNIQFSEIEADSTSGNLIGKIYMPMQIPQSYTVDIEGTNTSGNLGIAGNVNYQHRNIFKGAQILNLKFTGATERQIALINNQKQEFNMRELGSEARLTIPGILIPTVNRLFNFNTLPTTQLKAAYSFQERPDYTRTITSLNFGYNWKSNPKLTHNLRPVELNVVRIFRQDSSFISSIKDLYIKSSYTDHVISSTAYSFTYNDRESNSRYKYFRLNVETAGNILYSISSLANRNKYGNDDPDDPFSRSYYQLFNTRFAQYLKGDFDFRYGYRLDKYNAFAYRMFLGVGLPYGNMNVMPFEKKYFTGGANGIRAWQVRSLGPGSYAASDDEYPNQSGDIKIEANVEYRFKLFWMFEGALFVDAGNVWAINEGDNRPGAVFKYDAFYDEVAVGSGFGLRVVSSYFILRTDIGIKMRDPARQSGQRWIIGNRQLNRSDFNLNIGIGYPF